MWKTSLFGEVDAKKNNETKLGNMEDKKVVEKSVDHDSRSHDNEKLQSSILLVLL